jgi:predicted deacylase
MGNEPSKLLGGKKMIDIIVPKGILPQIKEITMDGEKVSEVVEIGSDNPVIGVVGLVHGDESVGRIVLDEMRSLQPLCGTLRLIYANLPAERAGKRCVETNLNRVFPGKKDGKLEERIAYGLQECLRDCELVIDLHEMYEQTPAFVISHVQNSQDPRFYQMAQRTGLEHYTITGRNANFSSLIDFVNQCGGMGISIECGKTGTQESVRNAKSCIENILRYKKMIAGKPVCSVPQTYAFQEMVSVTPGADFTPYGNVRNFELLRANTPIGISGGAEVISPSFDCFPIFYNGGIIVDGKMVFVATRRIDS